MIIHLTLKNSLSLVVGACVVGLALITLLVDPQHLSWFRWQSLTVFLGLAAISALIWQTTIQSREDHNREVKESRRDERQEGIETKLTQLAQLVSGDTEETSNSESSLESMHPPVDFNATKYFQTAFQSVLTLDVEKRIRIAYSQNKELFSPEEFYVKLIGIGLVAYSHDMLWAHIWKSQFLMLIELNRRGGFLLLSEAKGFYTKAVNAYPEYYTSYAFEQWLAFMESQALLIKHPTETLEITVCGRDFLAYSGHHSRFPEERRG